MPKFIVKIRTLKSNSVSRLMSLPQFQIPRLSQVQSPSQKSQTDTFASTHNTKIVDHILLLHYTIIKIDFVIQTLKTEHTFYKICQE